MNEITNKIYSLLDECEAKGISQREESIKLLEESFSLYEQVRKDKGENYCFKKLSGIPKRMGELVNKLIEYNT